MILTVKDCSPFDTRLSSSDIAWLKELALVPKHDELVVRLEAGRDDEPIVVCDPDGTWRAGRYVGRISYKNRELVIRPRFGDKTILAWISGVSNIALVDTQGTMKADDWVVHRLLGSIWANLFERAARHGLPFLRADNSEIGFTVKGKLDVLGTVKLRTEGRHGVASVRRDKSLDNPIVSAIVAAYSELSRKLRNSRESEWIPERVRDLMPHLISAVGYRPRVPTKSEIARVRLTPITAGFRSLAELSILIAAGRGLSPDYSGEGQCKGLLLDVAELWEMYVLACLDRAWPELDVIHGTREASPLSLFINSSGKPLGKLKPDALVRREGKIAAIVDAKYKRLAYTAWNPPPQREDMYQLAAYMARYGDPVNITQGVLAYPHDPSIPLVPAVEADGPWKLDTYSEIRFITLPHDIDEAVIKLRRSVPLSGAINNLAA